MIQNRVLVLKNPIELNNGLKFPAGQEFEIVMDVVYSGGHMLPPDMQAGIYNWIVANPILFKETTKNW